MKCDQCEALMIQGVYCHETGCPKAETEDWDHELLDDDYLILEDHDIGNK